MLSAWFWAFSTDYWKVLESATVSKSSSTFHRYSIWVVHGVDLAWSKMLFLGSKGYVCEEQEPLALTIHDHKTARPGNRPHGLLAEPVNLE